MSDAMAPETAPRDVLLENVPPQAQWAAIVRLRSEHPTGLWVVITPHTAHPVMTAGGDLRVTRIVPDMSDDARRATAQTLRAREVDLLLVTPERFAQEKFLTFLRELAPSRVVVASADGCVAHAPEVRNRFSPLAVLRNDWQGMAKLILSENSGDTRKLRAFFNLDVPPTEQAPPTRTITSSKPVQQEVRHPGWEQAFQQFRAGMSLSELGAVMQHDESWCVEALLGFIAYEKRTNPFPWVSQPDYLVVAMAAGQAESTDPAIILPIVADRVSPGPARIALAALRNRSIGRPRS